VDSIEKARLLQEGFEIGTFPKVEDIFISIAYERLSDGSILATSYIEVARSGNGRRVVDELDRVLQEHASIMSEKIIHIVENMYNNPVVDHLATIFGYTFSHVNKQNQNVYIKTYYPAVCSS
jgi:hypothetical protein